MVAAIDTNAKRLGLSRNEYLRRQLAAEALPHPTVTVDDLTRSAEVFADIDDPDVMSGDGRTYPLFLATVERP